MDGREPSALVPSVTVHFPPVVLSHQYGAEITYCYLYYLLFCPLINYGSPHNIKSTISIAFANHWSIIHEPLLLQGPLVSCSIWHGADGEHRSLITKSSRENNLCKVAAPHFPHSFDEGDFVLLFGWWLSVVAFNDCRSCHRTRWVWVRRVWSSRAGSLLCCVSGVAVLWLKHLSQARNVSFRHTVTAGTKLGHQPGTAAPEPAHMHTTIWTLYLQQTPRQTNLKPWAILRCALTGFFLLLLLFCFVSDRFQSSSILLCLFPFNEMMK